MTHDIFFPKKDQFIYLFLVNVDHLFYRLINIQKILKYILIFFPYEYSVSLPKTF